MSKEARRLLADSIAIIIGSALTALGLSVFTVPNNIAPGGVSGIAIALSSLIGVPVGTLTLILNVPLMAVALKRLGFKPLAKTIAATVLLSVFIDLFALWMPGYTNNPLLAALMGGGFMGVGLGLLLIRGISTGGTDLIGLMLFKMRPGFSMGQLLMVIDTLVVIFAVAVFREIEVALYSVVSLFVTSKMIDAIQEGVDHAKVIYIITDREEELLNRIAHEMGRGVTVLPGRGGFSGKDKAVLMTIARRNEVALTLQAVRAIDPRAFTIISDATEVHGEGFKEGED
ncbi:MAG TPA: YitT family protein [Feifaniaceae bacterium]|nr:YitT family protein [Feifaniaceae bacterium]